jgi:site-specific DNA-methyltransferase (adenine-specific)
LNPKYISLIIPARWMTGGLGLGEFRREMLDDNRIRILHDYLDSKDCFSNVSIPGGICYFLWDRDNTAKCKIITHINNAFFESERTLRSPYSETFIRFPEQMAITEKVWTKKEAEHCLGYIRTKFFRFLVGIIKTTQDAPSRVYQLVPLQDFSESWSDEKLYKKYKLTKEEIAFIERMIKEM